MGSSLHNTAKPRAKWTLPGLRSWRVNLGPEFSVADCQGWQLVPIIPNEM
jgi:hypothetical protein